MPKLRNKKFVLISKLKVILLKFATIELYQMQLLFKKYIVLHVYLYAEAEKNYLENFSHTNLLKIST